MKACTSITRRSHILYRCYVVRGRYRYRSKDLQIRVLIFASKLSQIMMHVMIITNIIP